MKVEHFNKYLELLGLKSMLSSKKENEAYSKATESLSEKIEAQVSQIVRFEEFKQKLYTKDGGQ